MAESVGISQAAKRLGMPSSGLGNWAPLNRKGKLQASPRATPIAGSAAELEAENSRLRRELANAKLDLEIVKKSGGVFREAVAVRYAWIEQYRDDCAVTRLRS